MTAGTSLRTLRWGADAASYFGAAVAVQTRSGNGEAVFLCKDGKVPRGMIFVPYGPPTCKLMGQTTDGTGMPTSKGWEVEVEPVSADTPKG